MGELLRMSDFTPTTPVVIDASNGSISVCIRDVLRWLCPNTPEQEAFRFLMTCKSARVNPFEGEAYLVKYGDKWTIVFDKSGWLHRAEDHPMFNGFQFGIIVRNFNLETRTVVGRSYDIEGTFIEDDQILVGGWSRIHRKDRRFPTVARISLQEYRQKSPTWDRITCTMAAKVALIQSLRHSGVVFAYRGYDRDEMPAPPGLPSRPDPGPVSEAIDVEFSHSPIPSLSVDLMVEIKDAINALRMTDAQVAKMLDKRNVSCLADLTDFQAQDIILKLKAQLDQRDAGTIMLPDAKEEITIPSGAIKAGDHVHIDADGVTVVNGEIVDGLPQEEKDRLLAKSAEELVKDDAHEKSMAQKNEFIAEINEAISDLDTISDQAMAQERAESVGIDLSEPTEDFPDVSRPEGSPKKARKKKD